MRSIFDVNIVLKGEFPPTSQGWPMLRGGVGETSSVSAGPLLKLCRNRAEAGLGEGRRAFFGGP